jgi:hypothetical protein
MIRPKLNKEQRLEIIQMYDQGKPIAHLAQQFQCYTTHNIQNN